MCFWFSNYTNVTELICFHSEIYELLIRRYFICYMYNDFILTICRNMNCSLIICTYNWPEALNLVLLSTLNQSVSPNEIIIADDGSGESTAKVIENFISLTSIPNE